MRDMFKTNNIKVSREFFGMFNSTPKDPYYGNKIDMEYDYVSLMQLYHFYSKESLAKISKFYSMIGKECLDVCKRVSASGRDEDEREITPKDVELIKSGANNRWLKEAKSLEAYHRSSMKKFGIDYKIDNKNIILYGVQEPYGTWLVYVKRENTSWADVVYSMDVIDTSNNLQRVKYLTELKNNIDKIIFNAYDLYIDKAVDDFMKCQYSYYEDDKKGFDYNTGDNDIISHAFYDISDQGHYGPYILMFKKEGDKDTRSRKELEIHHQITDIQKEYLIKRIDDLIIQNQ